MPDRTPRELLDAWRELERRQATAAPDGPEFDRLELDIARIRSEYHRVATLHIAVSDQLRTASRESQKRVQASAHALESTRAMLRKVTVTRRSRRVPPDAVTDGTGSET